MAKQIYEINSFGSGIVSNPKDELDLPQDAATASLNIDPLNNGELTGIPDVQILKTSGFANQFTAISYTRAPSYVSSSSTMAPLTDGNNTQ